MIVINFAVIDFNQVNFILNFVWVVVVARTWIFLEFHSHFYISFENLLLCSINSQLSCIICNYSFSLFLLNWPAVIHLVNVQKSNGNYFHDDKLLEKNFFFHFYKFFLLFFHYKQTITIKCVNYSIMIVMLQFLSLYHLLMPTTCYVMTLKMKRKRKRK